MQGITIVKGFQSARPVVCDILRLEQEWDQPLHGAIDLDRRFAQFLLGWKRHRFNEESQVIWVVTRHGLSSE